RMVPLPRYPRQSAYRGDVEDSAALRLHHHKGCGTGEIERAGKIRPDNLGPVLLAHHHQQLVAREPGVVDQPVDPPEAALHRVDHLAHGLEVANVGLERHHLDAERFELALQFLGPLLALQKIKRDIGAVAGCLPRDSTADSPRRPRNNYPLAVEVFHRISALSRTAMHRKMTGAIHAVAVLPRLTRI